MSGLHPDESYCTSEIGTLLFQPKNEWSGTVKVVDIVSSKGLAGTHNDYILEFKFVPRQVVEIDSRTFTLTTRFRELDRVHKGLQKTHKQLYLRGTFPNFAPTKLIGSGEPAVLAERRNATEVFLNFVLDSEVLRKSVLLHQFLDKACEKVHTAIIAADDIYSTIDTGLTPITPSVDSPTEEQPTNVASSYSSSDFDLQFPEVALGDLPRHSNTRTTLRRQFPKIKMDLERLRPNTSDYLVRAGILISTAQKAEAENEFELAFQCYKNAAKSLSEGLRTETDIALRNSVKLKTAKYIVRAEQLFRNYLSYDGSATYLEGLLADSLHLHDPSIFAFKCSNSGLKDYVVVGVLPGIRSQHKVLLMEEKSTGNHYVMKFLDKGKETSETRIILPTSVPHMVQLYKFFETEDHILLLLQHGVNGRLSDFLNRETKKLNKSKSKARKPHSIKREPRRYSYSGQKLLFSVGFDIERVVAMRDEQQSTEDPNSCELACAMGEDCIAEESGSGGEFLVTKAIAEEALQVAEEQPAVVKFRNPLPRPREYKGEPESLESCLKEVKELLLVKQSWPLGLSIPEPLVVHWSAQIVSFLYMLHLQHGEYAGAILPRNLLLDGNGSLLITYHGSWFTQHFGRSRGSIYCAPESQNIHWKPCASGDVYSLGCIIFELSAGQPLHEAAPHGLTRESEEFINKKGLISLACWDLLLKILCVEEERISLEEVRNHPYFGALNWNLYDNPNNRDSTHSIGLPSSEGPSGNPEHNNREEVLLPSVVVEIVTSSQEAHMSDA